MRKRNESKRREQDREKRQTGGWTGLGFAIVLIAAAILAFLLLMGSA